jgi:hypothetical protein
MGAGSEPGAGRREAGGSKSMQRCPGCRVVGSLKTAGMAVDQLPGTQWVGHVNCDAHR